MGVFIVIHCYKSGNNLIYVYAGFANIVLYISSSMLFVYTDFFLSVNRIFLFCIDNIFHLFSYQYARFLRATTIAWAKDKIFEPKHFYFRALGTLLASARN